MTDTKTPSDLAAEARATATSNHNKMQDIYNAQADALGESVKQIRSVIDLLLAKAQDEATFKWRTFEARVATIEADLAALRKECKAAPANSEDMLLVRESTSAPRAFKVGDVVTVARKFDHRIYAWIADMDEHLGRVGTIDHIDHHYACRVRVGDGPAFLYAAEALDLITPAED